MALEDGYRLQTQTKRSDQLFAFRLGLLLGRPLRQAVDIGLDTVGGKMTGRASKCVREFRESLQEAHRQASVEAEMETNASDICSTEEAEATHPGDKSPGGKRHRTRRSGKPRSSSKDAVHKVKVVRVESFPGEVFLERRRLQGQGRS